MHFYAFSSCVCVFGWVGGCEWVGARVWPYPNLMTFSHTHQDALSWQPQKHFDKFIIFVFPKHSRSIRISFRGTFTIVKGPAGTLRKVFFGGNQSLTHSCMCRHNRSFDPRKERHFLLKPTDGSGSEARHAAAKVQTHISVYLTISEPRSMGHRDHYWWASIRPLKPTVAMQLLLSCDHSVPVTL